MGSQCSFFRLGSGDGAGDGTETALMVLDDLILGKGSATSQSPLKVRSRGLCVINLWLVQLIWSGGLVSRPYAVGNYSAQFSFLYTLISIGSSG